MPNSFDRSTDALRVLLTQQQLAVVATAQPDGPYTSLVAFAASEDLRQIGFMTGRRTRKYRNLELVPQVALLIDTRTHSAEDFSSAAALTVLGSVRTVPRKRTSGLFRAFVDKHPSLAAFAADASTALCAVEVEAYLLVRQFQQVVEYRLREGRFAPSQNITPERTPT